MSPGSRSNNFITMREESREIVMFGGDSDGGPTSDLWAYNIEDEFVKSIYWRYIQPQGRSPPRAYKRSVCDYIHQSKHYIAVYGGKGKTAFVHSLFM